MKAEKSYIKPDVVEHKQLTFETVVSGVTNNICVLDDGTQIVVNDNRTWDFFK